MLALLLSFSSLFLFLRHSLLFSSLCPDSADLFMWVGGFTYCCQETGFWTREQCEAPPEEAIQLSMRTKKTTLGLISCYSLPLPSANIANFKTEKCDRGGGGE